MTDSYATQTSGALLAGRLNFGWWASNGPTAGYLVSLVLESVGRLSGLDSVTPRSVDLRIVRLAAADDFDVTAAFAQAAGGVATVMVTLAQREPFATASVQLGRRLAEESIAPSHRLSAFPPEAYAEMEMGRPDRHRSQASSRTVRPQTRTAPARSPAGTSCGSARALVSTQGANTPPRSSIAGTRPATCAPFASTSVARNRQVN